MEKRILFVCRTNDARSQMAEALFNASAPEDWAAMSAGFESGELPPLAMEIMREAGLDTGNISCKTVFDLYKRGLSFLHIVTLCEKEHECPVFPGVPSYISWPTPDPMRLLSADDEATVRSALNRTLQELRSRVSELLETLEADRTKTQAGGA